MRSLKKLSVLALAVFALSAIGVANASAAQFTASATGELHGKALNTQVFKTSTGVEVKCTSATTTGKIVSLATAEQHVTINYSGCSAVLFGTTFGPVHITATTATITANGEIHLSGTIKMEVTGANCSLSIGAQTRTGLSYTNNAGKIKEKSNVTGITYTTTGGLCGSAGTATYTGESELERVGGGSISWDA